MSQRVIGVDVSVSVKMSDSSWYSNSRMAGTVDVVCSILVLARGFFLGQAPRFDLDLVKN